MKVTGASTLLLAAAATTASATNLTHADECGCGYRDPSTKNLYTESIIVYFNESEAIDHRTFQILNYEHKREKGWSSIYRQGAQPSNVGLGNEGAQDWQDAIDGDEPSLELWVDPPTHEHVINGAQLQSVRQDIMYGTFRASMRSPQPWVGGSSLGMLLEFNDTQSLEIDMMNMNNASDAYVANLVNGEWPSHQLGTNYSTLATGNKTLAPIKPWDFIDVRFDWSHHGVDFWVGQNLTRTVTKKDRSLPEVPLPLGFRHWATGDTKTMEGPPVNRSVANVQFVRAFFNSSLMTTQQHDEFDKKCNIAAACSIDDHSIRGSSHYSSAAAVPWKQPKLNSHIRKAAGIVAGVFSTFGVIAIINAFIRRTPWHKLKKLGVVGKSEKAPPRRGSIYDKSIRRASVSMTGAIRNSIRQSMSGGRKKSKSLSISYPIPINYSAEHLVHDNGPVSPSIYTDSQFPSRRTSMSDLHESGSRENFRRLTPAPSYKSLDANTHASRNLQLDRPGVTPLPSYRSLRGAGGMSRDISDETDVDNKHSTSLRARRQSNPFGDSPFANGSRSSLTPSSEDEIVFATKDGNIIQAKSDKAGHLERLEMPRNPFLDKFRNPFEQGELTPIEKRKQQFIDPEDHHLTENDRKIALNEVGRTEEPPVTPGMQDTLSTGIAPIPKIAPKTEAPPPATKRIDYLAGFLALSCIGVTFRHFSLTFWPYVTEGSGNTKHFGADTWLAYILGPYILTPLWIGPFFVTSCRFLAARFLKNGKLSDIANKVLLRGARMLIPCFVFMTLEYFLISLGLTGMLEYLPAVSYSTWPYVTPQGNFGVFMNEMVELSYLIPNSAPEVINHYCVGVLWTIPVQHFFSYVTLLAAVMVRDIKTPWKRFTFYGLTIAFGWYASSWSACHWMGLMLADLDITYGWIKWMQARPKYLYPLLAFCTLVAAVSPLVLLFNAEIFRYSFMSYENAIHPDAVTGLPIFDVVGASYPDYFQPSLAVLLFSTSLQIIVEMSTWVQWFFSLKMFTLLHPYIMTIYLMHGFVFWSIGAFIAVNLSAAGVHYAIVLTVVGIVCYFCIFLFAWLVSPLIEFTTQSAMKNIWRWATEEPIPHRETTAPFTKSLVIDRDDGEKQPEA